MRRLTWSGLALLLTAVPSVLSAQADTVASKDSADVLLLSRDFIQGSREFVRVFLQKGQVYRAELSSPDVQLIIRPLRPGTEPAFVAALQDFVGASGAVRYEIYPRADGDYEIAPTRGTGVGNTTLMLYRDIKASRRRQRIISSPGWELGVELAAGAHTGYKARSHITDPVSPTGSGVEYEGCFTARNAPGLRRLSGCAFGIGYQRRPETRDVVWFFIEPRFAVLGHGKVAQSNFELGVLFRAGLAETEGTSSSLRQLTPGVYVARHVRRNQRGSGWSFVGSYSRPFYRGDQIDGSEETNRLVVAVGWYQ